MQNQTIHSRPGILAPLLRPKGWLRGLRDVLLGQPQPYHDIARSPVIRPRRSMGYILYRERRRRLPVAFGMKDWDRALDYWDHRCAICERPRGLWHTISQDHWVPLTDPNCPGTIPTNMLPLCYGTDGCNNSKGKKSPDVWLKEKLGTRKARKKLEEIYTFFAWVEQFMEPLAEDRQDVLCCPDCGTQLDFVERRHLWHCTECGAHWRETQH